MTEREKQRDLLSTGSFLSWPQWWRQGQVEDRSLEYSIWVSHVGGNDLSALGCLPLLSQEH